MPHEFLSLAHDYGTGFILALALVARLVVLASPKGSEPRQRFRFAFSVVLIHLIFLIAATLLSAYDPVVMGGAKVGVALTSSLAAVTLGSILLFEGLVRRLRPGLPRIVPDVVTTLAAMVSLVRASHQLGFEVTGVIATSAVLTAVVGLSLQDTLGNVLGGLALQLDSSVQVGDWVRLPDVAGRVTQIRWRYTAIETNNWETVIVPNSTLMRGQVVIMGRREGKPVQWRRWVHFQVDFRTAPGDVIDVVERALRAQPIPNVASDPRPNCIATDFAESQTKYAVRYWLTELSADDPTDSVVRNYIFHALARARIPLSIPAQTVFVTEDDQARHEYKRATEHERRMEALATIDLFASLNADERTELALSLERAPFPRGATITQEGAVAHHLYMILSGDISVRAGGLEENREVGRLKAGDIFGEMALLTGERRSASLIALTDVNCYRLDAKVFRALLEKRPDLAERVAQVLADRQTGLTSARERSKQQAALRAENERAILSKIKAFFDLD
ncbi:MAG: mechanosensitive ion channel family protein [Myxococcales bacterium]